MQIKLRSTWAHPLHGAFDVGATADVPAAIADDLVADGHAEPLDDPADPDDDWDDDDNPLRGSVTRQDFDAATPEERASMILAAIGRPTAPVAVPENEPDGAEEPSPPALPAPIVAEAEAAPVEPETQPDPDDWGDESPEPTPEPEPTPAKPRNRKGK